MCLLLVVAQATQRVHTSLIVIVTPHLCDAVCISQAKEFHLTCSNSIPSCVLWIVARTTFRNVLISLFFSSTCFSIFQFRWFSPKKTPPS